MDKRIPIVANKLKEILAPSKALEMAEEIIKALDDDGGIKEDSITPSTPPDGGGGGVSNPQGVGNPTEEQNSKVESAVSKVDEIWSPKYEEVERWMKMFWEFLKTRQRTKS
jgi:hypothetical protein